MPTITGRITRMRIYLEEGRMNFILFLCKVIWFIFVLLLPFCIFRFVWDVLGLLEAIISVTVFLVATRILGPANLLILDELLARVIPTTRAATRYGSVRVYDFRLQEENGIITSCLLKGDLRAGSPMTGDRVALQGTLRSGTLEVQNGQNITTGAQIATVPSFSSIILIIVLFLASISGLYLTGVLDSIIYPIIIYLMVLFF